MISAVLIAVRLLCVSATIYGTLSSKDMPSSTKTALLLVIVFMMADTLSDMRRRA